VQAPETEETIDLREYIAIVRTRKWTIILTAALVVIATLAFSLQQTPLYTAEARLLVEPLPPSEQETLAPVVNLETERELVQSVPVAELVKEELDLDTPVDDLLANLDVQVVTETEVLIVAYTSDDPAFSQQATNAFAQAYIENRQNQELEDRAAARDAVEKRIDRINEQLTEVRQQLQQLDTEPADNEGARLALEQRETGLISQLAVRQDELSDTSSGSVRLRAGQIIAPATLPTAPSSPNLLRNGLLAAFLGLALGIALAFLRERLQDRFKGREDVERVLGAPVLATIPRFSFKARNDADKLVVRTEPKSAATEAYRSLRTNLEFVSSALGRNSFLVTSPSAAEGKSITTANLGLAFAQSDRRTIIISGDLRRPTIEKIFGLGKRDGLSNYLAGQSDDLPGLIVNPEIPHLRILPTGPVPPNPAELMTSPRLAQLITDLEGACDILLIDGAPTLPVADAKLLGASAAGVVLVVNAENTRRGAADHARTELLKVGGNLAGVVLNAYDPSTSAYAYYQTYYYDSGGQIADNGDRTAIEERPKKSSKFGFRR
jgi:non-specific protein-tyrosine kinase